MLHARLDAGRVYFVEVTNSSIGSGSGKGRGASRTYGLDLVPVAAGGPAPEWVASRSTFVVDRARGQAELEAEPKVVANRVGAGFARFARFDERAREAHSFGARDAPAR